MTALDGDGGQDAAGRGEPRPDATGLDTDYCLSIEDVAERYSHAGHPRTIRTLQRYCVSGHLDCRKVETTFGDKFLVAPYSVSRHIAQVNEIASMTRGSTSRDQPRPVATTVALPGLGGEANATTLIPATSGDQPRPAATSDDDVAADRKASGFETRYVEALERENGFLRDQIGRKDTQIAELSERARETNFLIKGLQDLFLRLQPGQVEAARVSAPEKESGAPPVH